MFDGMPEQFYQFLAARTTTTPSTNNITTTSLPLSFTLQNHTTTNNGHHHFSTYSSPTQQQQSFDASSYHHLLHHHPHFLTRNDVKHNGGDNDDGDEASLDPSSQHSDLHTHTIATLHDGSQRSLTMLLPEIPWSNDEMLALFRIRSSVDNSWFPDYIWETVSRKLAELGFKRSAEKCKEKFEEETRCFNSTIISNCNNNSKNNNASNNNNYRLFHELEELCNNNNHTNNNTISGHNDHGNLHQQHPLLAPTTTLPPSDERGQFSQLPLSPKDQCLGGDEEDDDNEDDENDLGMDDEGGNNAGGEKLGDEKEEREGLSIREDYARNVENKNNVVGGDEQSVGDSEKTEENTKRVTRKRKRQKKFEMFKGFCEKIVNEMMAQQQQLHCKILQDMVKRDEEKIAKEEAWKKQEIERLEKELEARAHEQAIAGDRQVKICDFLKKFSTSSSNVVDSQSLREALEKLNKVPNFTSSNSSILSQDSIISAQLQPTSSCTTHDDDHTPLVNHQIKTTCRNMPMSSSNENLALLSPIRLENPKVAPPMSSPSMDQASQNPNLVISHNESPRPPSTYKVSKSNHTSINATAHVTNFKTQEDQNDTTPVVISGKDDTGRRWPRDEVLALINIRCSLFNNNNASGGDAHNDKEGFSKGPLWERISHKMTELGYKRSAKRCKEKWENINKYFRKTKDMNKKRSIDSRTCPYFHQLSHLYSQGTLVGPTDRPVDLPGSPETSRSMAFSVTQGGSSTPANDVINNTMHTSQGNEGVVQVPGFDFEF